MTKSQGEGVAYDKRRDAVGEQLVNEIRVPLDALLVHRVVPPTKRDNARPGDGEAVRVDAILLEESNILGMATIGCRIVSSSSRVD
jgi:hypothetical protein